MPKSGKGAQIAGVLNAHVQSIHEILQILDKSAPSSLDNVPWPEVGKLGDQISKQATISGMLWNERTPDVKEVEENLGAYFNVLHGFILLCHGSTVGAGPSLHSCIRASAKQVIDSSLSLLTAVSSYGSSNAGSRMSIPQLSGSVWEACASLKKTPTTNCTAIGRAVTQVAVSVKDVLREMKELKPASCAEPTDGTPDGDDVVAQESNDEGSSMVGDFDDGLLPEEMNIAQLVICVTSDKLLALKEVIRFLAGLLKSGDHESSTNDYIESLERLLQHCQEIGAQVSDLGACVYPPQEVPLMQSAARKMNCAVVGVQTQVEIISGSHEALQGAFEGLKSSLRKPECELSGDLIAEMGKLTV